MLGGIVQHIAEHLLEPLGIGGNRFVIHAAAVVLQCDALLLEDLMVGIHGILKFRLQIHLLQVQCKAAVGHFGEIQQLLHHFGQAAGFLHDDAQSAAQGLRVAAIVGKQRLAPSVDGRQGRAQLVGHGGDEFRLELLVLPDLHGHIVDVVHQFAHFIGITVGDPEAVAAAGDPLGRLADGGNRRHHIVDQQQAGDNDHKDHRRHNGYNDQHCQQYLAVQIPGGGHKAHNAHHPSVELQQAGGGNDLLPGGRIRSPEAADLAAAESVDHILCSRHRAGHQTAGGDLHLAASVNKLQLNGIAVLKAVGVERSAAVVFVVAGHGVSVEILRTGIGLGLQRTEGAGIIVAAQCDRNHRRNQHQNGDNGKNAADKPAAAQADGTFWLL